MRSTPARDAIQASPAKVARKGLSDGHGLPARTARIGRPTQMPTHSRTAGSGEMSPTRIPAAMAPYHQAMPSTRRPILAVVAKPTGTVRVG